MSKKLNQMYYDEGWGKLAEAATALEPVNVESQARTVARYAAPMIEQMKECLVEYKGKYCEGYCSEGPYDGTDCGGCAARLLLESLGNMSEDTPKYTVHYNIPGKWIGTGWEFFSSKRSAENRFMELRDLLFCPTIRPFHEETDRPHMGAVHRTIDRGSS